MTSEERKRAAIQAGIDTEVRIWLEKKAGEATFKRSIEASSLNGEVRLAAAAALNGLAILIAEFSVMTQNPVDSVLGMLAAVLIAPAGDDVKQ